VNTESKTPTNPAPASSGKKTKSGLEKVLFRGFLLISVLLIAFEARAKFGYDYSLEYLKKATAAEEIRVTTIKKQTEGEVKTVAEETEDATWAGLRSDAFENLSFLAPILAGQAGEPIEFKPVLAKHFETGAEVQLEDADGKKVELDSETSFERSLRWHSIRDLWMPEPAYLLTVKVANAQEDADIVGFNNGAADGDMSKYFANPDRLKPAKFDPNAERSIAGFGGPPRRDSNEEGNERPSRPGSGEDGDEQEDKADESSDDKSEDKEEASDDTSENKEESSEDKNGQ
jgi:hypothetical protein